MDVDHAAAAAVDYPQLFRRMVVRSTEAALAAVDPKASKIEEEALERSLYSLNMALNLAAAWPAAQQLLLTISPYVEMHSLRDEWGDYLTRAIQQARSLNDIESLGKLHVTLGALQRYQDNYEAAQQYLLGGYRHAQQAKDRPTELKALNQLSGIAVERADYPLARQYVAMLLDMLPKADVLCAHCYSRLGYIAMRLGNWAEAIDWYSQSLNVFSFNSEVRFLAETERNLGFVLLYAKRYGDAIEHYERCLELLAQLESPLDWAKTQMELGVAYWYLGRHRDALALYEPCEPIFVKFKSQVSLAHLYNNRGLALRELDEFEKAKNSFDASIALMRELGHPLWSANAMESLGGLFLRMGKCDDAIAVWEQALHDLSLLPETPQYLHDLIARRIREASCEGCAKGNSAPSSP